ncbi:MAG: hypothetical protein K8J08_14620 [Thermoanaerobaculia bacterium]|nr:hypothetical protein [Thermoanaerobaculia bacterium]
MDIPNEVLIHNQILGLKGSAGTLIQIYSDGYYEINLPFGSNVHRVLLPIGDTVLISKTPEADLGPGIEVER